MEGTTNINLLHHFLASIHVHLIIFDHLVDFVGGNDWTGGRLGLRRVLWLDAFSSFCHLTCPAMVGRYSFSAKWPAPRFTILFLPRVRSLLQGQSSSSPALSQLYSENWPEDGRLIFPYISARCLEPNECCVAGHFHSSLGDLEPEQTSIVARGLSAQTAIFVKSISKPDNWPKFSSWQTSFATIIHTVPDMLCFRQDCSKAGGGNFGWQYMVVMSRMTLVVKDRSHWKNQQVLVLLYKSHSSVVHY